MVLRDVFYLEEHPFNPLRDPQTQFDFRARRAFLTQWLDMFQFAELVRFYSRVGAFGVAAQQASTHIARLGYPANGAPPPLVLIDGDSGQGVSTLAALVAAEIKRSAPQPTPAFERQPLGSDHLGKAVYFIAGKIAKHLKASGSPLASDLQDALAQVKVDDPDETSLLIALESMTADSSVPPLVLVVEKVTYTRSSWPLRLHRALRALNVMLICVTADPRVPLIFSRDVRLAGVNGFTLKLDGLTRAEALDFVRERLGLFRRQQAPPDRTGLYPFLEAEVNFAFNGLERLKISLLLRLLDQTFTDKLQEQERASAAGATAPHAAGQLPHSAANVASTYRSAISHAAAVPARGSEERS